MRRAFTGGGRRRTGRTSSVRHELEFVAGGGGDWGEGDYEAQGWMRNQPGGAIDGQLRMWRRIRRSQGDGVWFVGSFTAQMGQAR